MDTSEIKPNASKADLTGFILPICLQHVTVHHVLGSSIPKLEFSSQSRHYLIINCIDTRVTNDRMNRTRTRGQYKLQTMSEEGDFVVYDQSDSSIVICNGRELRSVDGLGGIHLKGISSRVVVHVLLPTAPKQPDQYMEMCIYLQTVFSELDYFPLLFHVLRTGRSHVSQILYSYFSGQMETFDRYTNPDYTQPLSPGKKTERLFAAG